MKTIPKISQSLINDALNNDVCPKRIEYKYVMGVEPDNDEEENVMFRGRYFEWHLIGKTRDGIEPKFEPLKRGGKPTAQRELDLLIVYAKDVLFKMGVDYENGRKQVYVESGNMSGNIDLITNDFTKEFKEAIYDIKYTETKYDDRYMGWADFETKQEAKRQAVQYILLHFLAHGEYVPFYFIVFGKSKWCRVIKVKITRASVELHEAIVQATETKMIEWQNLGYPATPEYMKCLSCDYNGFCKLKSDTPEIEVNIL